MNKIKQRLVLPNTRLSIGISQNQQLKCLVYQQQGHIVTHWLANNENELVFIEQNLQIKPFNYQLIRVIPHYYIWRKYLFLPSHYSPVMLHRQIMDIIQKTLPLNLSELNIDYIIEPLIDKKCFKIILYGLRKTYQTQFIPYKFTILDCELHCLVRAIHFIKNLTIKNIEQYSYSLGKKFFQFQQDGLLLSDKQIENTLFCNVESNELPNDIQDNSLYLRALGASLWNGKA